MLVCASEAQALAKAGVEDILIANQLVDPARIRQLIEVAKLTRLRVLVDSEENVEHLSKAFESTGIDLGVLLELDIGSHRCGVEPGEKATNFAAQYLIDRPGLRFDGLHAYHGHAVNMTDIDERTAAARQSMQLAVDTRCLIESKGIECPILTGGGSSTYSVIGAMRGVDELQLGTYVTMDCSYKHRASEFEPALTVLATVISCGSHHFVVNAGVKAIAHEFGPPEVADHPEFEILRFRSDEHTVVHAPDHAMQVGDRLHLVPSHACGTCNLHHQLVVHEDEEATDIWPISARSYPLPPT